MVLKFLFFIIYMLIFCLFNQLVNKQLKNISLLIENKKIKRKSKIKNVHSFI